MSNPVDVVCAEAIERWVHYHLTVADVVYLYVKHSLFDGLKATYTAPGSRLESATQSWDDGGEEATLLMNALRAFGEQFGERVQVHFLGARFANEMECFGRGAGLTDVLAYVDLDEYLVFPTPPHDGAEFLRQHFASTNAIQMQWVDMYFKDELSMNEDGTSMLHREYPVCDPIYEKDNFMGDCRDISKRAGHWMATSDLLGHTFLPDLHSFVAKLSSKHGNVVSYGRELMNRNHLFLAHFRSQSRVYRNIPQFGVCNETMGTSGNGLTWHEEAVRAIRSRLDSVGWCGRDNHDSTSCASRLVYPSRLIVEKG